MNIKQEVDDYLKFCEFQKKLDAKTLKAYSTDLGQFINHFSLNEEEILTKSGICSYIAKLHKFFSPKTAKRKLATLRAFFNHLEFEEIIDINPLRRIKTKFREPKILPKTISFETIQKLIGIAHYEKLQAKTKYEKFTAQRDVVVLEILFATGMRVSELCSLKTKDINLDNGCIRIMGKGTKERVIQVGNNEVLSILREYYTINESRINQTGLFFANRLSARLSEQSVRFMLKSFCAKADISFKITPHMFRHSFATLLLEEDVDIRYIQRMLGHSSIQTTQIYTQVTTEKQRQILMAKHPRNKMIVGGWRQKFDKK